MAPSARQQRPQLERSERRSWTAGLGPSFGFFAHWAGGFPVWSSVA